MEIKKVTVIGIGIMGNQIAMQSAIYGYETVCYGRSESSIQNAMTFAEDWFNKRIAKGKMNQEDAAEIQSRLTFTSDLACAAAGAEAVPAAGPRLHGHRQPLDEPPCL